MKEVRFSDIVLFNDESKNKKPFFLRDLKQYEVRKIFLKSFVKFSHTEPFKEYDVINDYLKEELQKITVLVF